MQRHYYVYLLTDHRNGTFYCGFTNDLVRRCQQHRSGTVPGFTSKFGLRHLVWYEVHDDPNTAIAREKSIKRWKRAYKLNVIERMNPDWRDLYHALVGSEIKDCPVIPDPPKSNVR